MMISQKLLMGLLFSSVLLAGCGDDDSDIQRAVTQPSVPKTEHQGHLVIANADTERPLLSVYDLNDKKNINTIALSTAPVAMYSSPQSRFAVLLSRNEGIVQFADSGIFLKDNKLQINTPHLLTYQFKGAKPTHFRSFNGQAAIFYDGSETETSKFDYFNDLAIEKQSIATQQLPVKHHGVAEPRGNYVLSTYLPKDSNILSMVKSYELHGDHFHEEQTLLNPCDKLHGAGSIANYTAFGCLDGVLVVEQNGNQFNDKKISIDQRITTIVGHEKLNQLVGFATGTGDMFIIDPKNLNAMNFDWTKGAKESDGITPVKRLQHVMNATGKYFVILDSVGTLHIIDTGNWSVVGKLNVIENPVATELVKSRLVVNAASESIFINDTNAKKILEIDLKTPKILQSIQLTDVPNTFTWVGNPSK